MTATAQTADKKTRRSRFKAADGGRAAVVMRTRKKGFITLVEHKTKGADGKFVPTRRGMESEHSDKTAADKAFTALCDGLTKNGWTSAERAKANDFSELPKAGTTKADKKK